MEQHDDRGGCAISGGLCSERKCGTVVEEGGVQWKRRLRSERGGGLWGGLGVLRQRCFVVTPGGLPLMPGQGTNPDTVNQICSMGSLHWPGFQLGPATQTLLQCFNPFYIAVKWSQPFQCRTSRWQLPFLLCIVRFSFVMLPSVSSCGATMASGLPLKSLLLEGKNDMLVWSNRLAGI